MLYINLFSDEDALLETVPQGEASTPLNLPDATIEERRRTEQNLALAETHLADYQARLGNTFENEQYLKELEALRDRLRMSLSGTPAEGEPSALELAERSKALKVANAVEAIRSHVSSNDSAAPAAQPSKCRSCGVAGDQLDTVLHLREAVAVIDHEDLWRPGR